MKAILTSKPMSKYDDLIEFRYHFPRTYLRQIERAVGDWIIYYEPRRISQNLNESGGRQSYFAVAQIKNVTPDQDREGHFYAYVDSYLEFDRPVIFRENNSYYESLLRKEDGSTNKGAFGRAVRNIPDHEFDAILQAGFEISLPGEEAFYAKKAASTIDHQGQDLPQSLYLQGFGEERQAPFGRPTVEKLVKRPFRDQAFRHAVRHAYENTCAMTGLKLINGGGRPEVQAAHIKPVSHDGTDSVRNGLALSGTVHWMFDRGLVSVDKDFSILIADDFLQPQMRQFFYPEMKLHIPDRPELRPHPHYLEYHRDVVFKG